jgi:uncharacterized protein
MTLKIICLEEHVADRDLTEAVRAYAAADAPYSSGLGSVLEEDLSGAPRDRPRLQGPRRAELAAGAPIAQRLQDMDRDQIDMQVLSSTRMIQLVPQGEAADLACEANDRLARIVGRHPGRFAAFATLPWQDAEAAVRELDRAVSELGFVGSLLAGRSCATALIDHPSYAPILAKSEALQAPLYIHPGPPFMDVQRMYYAGFNAEASARLSLYGWGWHNEAGIQIIRLILSGALDRHPGLRIITGHWGEMVPFFLQRLDEALPPAATGLKRSISQTYRDQVYVTPSGMLSLPHFQFIRAVVGIDRILFSVDYPYLTMAGARAWLEALPVSESERAAIAHGNAERLMRLA